jgi:poly-gamma-glutamate capsule biosynthesis protein CapA/YwtB (metallophosphatase superfamily)
LVATLFLCGDVMLARGIDQILPQPCPPALYESYVRDAREYIELARRISGPIPHPVAPTYPWGDALEVLDERNPDARIINLETSITRSTDRDRRKQIHYRVSPENARCLTAAKVRVCALGNNHVLDWGQAGLDETLATLDTLGIQRAGAGHDLAEAQRPALVELANGERLAVFSVGCADAGVPTSWGATAERPGVHVLSGFGDHAVRQLRRMIDPWRDARARIVLSIHWGANWSLEIPPEHRELAHRMIDEAGVDVVHGHSSHHVKGIEVWHQRLVLFGCGDLLTDYEGIRGYEEFYGNLGLLYFVRLDADGTLRALDMVPTRMHRFRITRGTDEEAHILAAMIARSGAELGTSVTVDDNACLRLAW